MDTYTHARPTGGSSADTKPREGESVGLMRLDDAASTLAISRRTLYRLIQSGSLPLVYLSRDLPRVRRTDVESLALTGITNKGTHNESD